MNPFSVNPGSGNPFVAVSLSDEHGSQVHMFVHDVTPAQLRKLADDLEAALARNATGRPAAEIRQAIATMDTPSYCPDCSEFRDATGQTCPECGGDSMLSYRDTPYYLECAEESEANGLEGVA